MHTEVDLEKKELGTEKSLVAHEIINFHWKLERGRKKKKAQANLSRQMTKTPPDD